MIQYRMVRFIRDHERFQGADNQIYGPYKKGQVAVIPVPNASLLEKQGFVERVRKEAEKPSLKQVWKGESLMGYVEAARTRPLTAFTEEEGKKRKEELLKEVEELLEEMEAE